MTVGRLKELIQDRKSQLRDIDADDLVLYKFIHSIPDVDDELFNDELNKWSPQVRNKLNGRTKLSDIFPEADGRELFIIVTAPKSLDSGALQPTGVAPNFRLNYWVYGSTADNFSYVEIPGNNTVKALKNVMKNEEVAALGNLAPSAILLYKVSIPLEDNATSVGSALSSLTLSELGVPLVASKRVLDVFESQPPDNHLHLIIIGLLTLQCWPRGEAPEFYLKVEVSTQARTDDLKNVIKTMYGRAMDGISPARLKLYKIPMGEAELCESLDTLGSGRPMQDELVKEVFNDVSLTLYPRVVIETFTDQILKSSASYRHVGNEDPITAARARFLKLTPTDKPSITSTPSQFRLRQLEPRRLKTIPCGRPRHYEEDVIPVTLFHPIFAQFVDDCQTVPVTADDNMFVEHLANVMSDLYHDEASRFRAVDQVFQEYGLHFTIAETKRAGYLTDASMDVNGHRYVIAEFKNEIGSAAAEPYFQAIEYYLESTKGTALKYTRSPLPCLLHAIFGPHIVFAGATWNLRPTVQVLSTPISFYFHYTDARNQLTVARHMVAFREATQRLKAYYESLRESSPPSSVPAPPQIFPYPTSYESIPNGTSKKFRYELALGLDKLIFHATEEEGDGICIKFVRTYSRDAHEFLARLDCAPRLRGLDELEGGWSMVVMDMIPDDFQTLYTIPKGQLPPSVYDAISEKIALFHQSGFVHGDIRDTNIMVSTSDPAQFMIIDFDWVGKITETPRYPVGVNYIDIARPNGARDGLPILQEHDVEMLKGIKDSKFEA